MSVSFVLKDGDHLLHPQASSVWLDGADDHGTIVLKYTRVVGGFKVEAWPVVEEGEDWPAYPIASMTVTIPTVEVTVFDGNEESSMGVEV